MYKNFNYFIISFIIIIDQFTKKLAKHFLTLKYKTFSIIRFSLLENKGMCCNLFSDLRIGPYIKYLMIFVIIISIINMNNNKNAKSQLIAWSLIISGGISNLLDRLFFGCVIDFIIINVISIKYATAAFNLADVSILVGIIMLISNNLIINLWRK